MYSTPGRGVAVPEELLNEPYSYEDNGLRPEVRNTHRLAFNFTIENDGTPVCSIGRQSLSRRQESPRRSPYDLPSKRWTALSVINVYDTYGLAITKSFLEYLYYNKYDAEYPSWLALYLVGSLCVIKPELVEEWYNVSEYFVPYLVSVLIIDLTQIDANQPRMLGSLTTVEQNLPEEVLNKILASRRMSKTMTQTLLASRCAEEPTDEELWSIGGYNNMYRAVRLGSGSYVNTIESQGRHPEIWIERVKERFKVETTLYFQDRDTEDDDVVIKYGIVDYMEVYKRRGCNVMESMRRWITALRCKVYIMNLEDLQAWFAIFWIYDDAGIMEITREFSERELRDELCRLMGLARDGAI